MAEKKDFMSELADEVAARKRGERDRIDGIDDFVSHRHENTPKTGAFDEEEPVIEEVKKKEPVKETKKEAPIPEPRPVKEITPEEAYDDDDGTPDSFAEEKLVPVSAPKKKMKPGAIIALAAIAAAALFAIWFFAFAPKIVMPDFVGKKLSDVSTWAKQNKMESSAIATSEPVFSMDYDEGVVMEQSVEAGKKVKTDTPITFTVSAGPDPEEAISFPDIKNMSKDEIDAWIKENKLSKAKITTQYSSTVEEGKVISYDLKNTAEEDFRRGTALTVLISKGAAPAGQVTVENFTNKTYAEAMSWAAQKKLVSVKTEETSATIEKGYVISQSITAGQTVDEGTTITFVVSKGKGVLVPNLVGYTKEELEAWQGDPDNTLTIVTKSVYAELPLGSVVTQSIVPNTMVDEGSVLELTTSLYLPILETNTQKWIGQNYLQLKAKVDEFNANGADIQAGEYGDFANREYSDTVPVDGIIEIACTFGTAPDVGNGCERPLNLNSRIAYRVSLGPKPSSTPAPAPEYEPVRLTAADMADIAHMQNFCNANSGKITCSFAPAAITDPATQKADTIQSITSNGVAFDLKQEQTLYKGASLSVNYYVNGSAVTENPQEPTDHPGQ